MIRDDQGDVKLLQHSGIKTLRFQDGAVNGHGWCKRIRVRHLRPAMPQQRDDLQRRGFTYVINVLLVGNPKNMNAGAAKRLLGVIEKSHSSNDAVFRHLLIDLVREIDESWFEAR